MLSYVPHVRFVHKFSVGVVHILRNQFLEHFNPPPPPPSVIGFTDSYCVTITLA